MRSLYERKDTEIMRILALSDRESPYLWDHFDKNTLQDIDLILSCGDLSSEYLSFLATMSHVPVLYVHGNHDDHYSANPPGGCICIEDKIYTHQGLRILGLGGSMRYTEGTHQYTQAEMDWRVRKLWLPLIRNGGFDILLTHSPAFGFGDDTDLPHTGFVAFNQLMERYHPSYMVHGHVHLNYLPLQPRVLMNGETQVINAYEKYIFEATPRHCSSQ